MEKMYTIGDAAAELGMPEENLPDEIKRIKAKCRINRY